MPYYRIKYVRDYGFLKKYRAEEDIEADDKADAMNKFVANYDVAPSEGNFVAKFLGIRRNIPRFRTTDGGSVLIVSVKETDTVRCGVCSGEGRYGAARDTCFACAGSGRITPQLSRRLNDELAAEIERRSLDRLGGEEYSRQIIEILNEMQYGDSSGDAE